MNSPRTAQQARFNGGAQHFAGQAIPPAHRVRRALPPEREGLFALDFVRRCSVPGFLVNKEFIQLLSTPWQIRRRLVQICHLAASKAYVAAYEGNVSARLPDGNIVITPTRLNKGEVSAEDLIVINPDGHKLQGTREPSSEFRMHTTIYAERPDAHAVVHAHPACATAFAVAGVEMCIDCMPETLVELGTIPLVPYGTPGTEELPDRLRDMLATGNAFLLQQHGVVTFGDSLDCAYYRMEQVEHAAQILLHAHTLGGAQSLDASSRAKLKRMNIEANPQKKTGP